MKKSLLLCCALPLLLSGCSCSSGDGVVYTATPLLGLNKEKKIESITSINLSYPYGADIPYINLSEGFSLVAYLRQNLQQDADAAYTAKFSATHSTITDERGLTCEVDTDKQTITFAEFDRFLYGDSIDTAPLSPAPVDSKRKAIKLIPSKSSFTRGQTVTISLANYPTLALLPGGGGKDIRVPFAVFSDIFISGRPGFTGAPFNFKDLYFVTEGLRGFGSANLNILGKKFFADAPKSKTINSQLTKFAYEETMFNLDYFYGLKGLRNISSFQEFAKEKGLEEDLLSGDVEKMDNAYARLLLRSLQDGHTIYFTPIPFRNYSEFALGPIHYSEAQIATEKADEALQEARALAKCTKRFEIVDDTAFIFFTSFDELDETVLYGTLDEDAIDDNNCALFAYAYQEIHKHPEVKNVVVDLLTNEGGDAESLAYCLGTVLGEFHLDSQNPLSGARNRSTYRTDINVDGVIDEKDVPLCDDYRVVMLDSLFSFSCGNLFPVAAMYNNPDIKSVGERTGGGCCAISGNYNALGASYLTSSLLMLTKEMNDGSFQPIEDGAEVDLPLTRDKMFDRAHIVTLIDNAFGD